MKRRVVFLRDASPYAAGEAAGFEHAEALRLRDAGTVAIPGEEAAAEAVIEGELANLNEGGAGEGSPGSEGSSEHTGEGVGTGDGAGGAGDDGNGDGTAVVEIPADWKALHHMTKKKLAHAISGDEPADLAAAEAVIEGELAQRAAQT